ncbi:uncharacterized protein DNG_01502 [Cephalotrichum gorgonifer]|uniref:Abhydrolase_3 domain-containing protein n=1 Tax=Cephalotrichum gorgonifer TaxID=2041049 RepID=A0AAE8MRQ9_9PEZI|nr:uncharacterized protein DNG_01502 [Cephalotrichum gorgonifer]
MSSFPLQIDGYKSKTLDFKSTKDGAIKLDVFYPENVEGTKRTVVLHYHGGFLVVGNRYSFFPYWMVRGCVSRGWILVSPDYRLIPESTAQALLEDSIDAYNWVLSSLPSELGCTVDSVLMAGSSAGGYLALATAASVPKKPSALLLLYGMLDPTFDRYLTPGTTLFGGPPTDTSPILARFPISSADDDREKISSYPVQNLATDARFPLVGALHSDALVPDYMTGIPGLARSIRAEGVEAIPQVHRNLFPLSFGDLKDLPRALLVHGTIDPLVPVDLSTRAADVLGKAGVEVDVQLPTDADHGFDAKAGDVDIEGPDGEKVVAYGSLRHALKFLDSCAGSSA